MRIISGKYKGRILSEFNGKDIRPTSDRAREALFNILQLKIANSSFLDLFCGTGAVGIEAVSRGASVVFVDNSRESVKLTEKNLSLIKESAKVVLSDAKSFIMSLNEKFDLIFLDPPYKLDVSDVLLAVNENKSLNDGGVLIYEHTGEFDIKPEGLVRFDRRKYGIAVFDFYRYEV